MDKNLYTIAAAFTSAKGKLMVMISDAIRKKKPFVFFFKHVFFS